MTMPEWLKWVLIVILVVAGGALVVDGMSRWTAYEQAKIDACLRAGYADRIQWQTNWFCVGYDREGMPVIAEWRSLWEVYSR
jgi:hypothetical protein